MTRAESIGEVAAYAVATADCITSNTERSIELLIQELERQRDYARHEAAPPYAPNACGIPACAICDAVRWQEYEIVMAAAR